jgi:TolB-like protein/DNA-binding winged helix-turn-helix (wHTH) protein/Tfp pilus assembly protein PilF
MSLIANDAPPTYRVDDLLVDVGRARVTRGDRELALPKLSFDLLLALIERSPAIVSPDELMTAVWPGLVVSPETISQRIKLLRGALDDDSKEPRYVAGVRGRGYRLLPAAERMGAEARAAEPATETSAVTGDARRRSVPTWQWLIAVVAVAALGFAVVANLRDRAPPVASQALPLPPRSVAVLLFESVDATPRGKVFALGISEAVLHQLASVRELSVIARTSSFTFAGHNEDARSIGAKLNARYLLEGSVQAEGEGLRVTAQLIDASTGDHMWSMRFDRTSQDVFGVQDEIALAVTRALKLTLDAPATDRLLARRASSLDAYFAYLQGRELALTLRMAELEAAAKMFALAIKEDPTFAAAYVDLANVQLKVAEFEITEDRQRRFDAARAEAERLIARALALDPQNGEAYAARAYLRAFTDLAASEADYRRSIELSPSYAPAYEGLASVLYETVAKRVEALAMLERARQLDPYEPRYDVTKAVYLMYWRGQIEAAAALLHDVIERDPLYQPALARYGEACFLQAEFAESSNYLEQAIELDPLSSSTFSVLMSVYYNLGEPAAAASVYEQYGNDLPGRRIYLQVYRQEWRAAGETAYAGFADRTFTPIDEGPGIIAVRMHARITHDFKRARELLEKLSGVTWNSSGAPQVPMQSTVAVYAVALADVLIAEGLVQRGRDLLRASLADMDRVMKDYGRGDFWYMKDRTIAFALLGENEAALAEIRRAISNGAGGGHPMRTFLELEPAFAALRDQPAFKQMQAEVRAHAAAERESLRRMRAEGLVPQRP